MHLFLHGGGWVAGSAHDKYIDILSRERAVGASCVVVAVDYRKAPEHTFPTGLEDAQAALEWVVAHAGELDVRPDLLTVGGQSAGANLAAALALKLRDERGPGSPSNCSRSPALDLTLSLPSHETYGTGYGLDLADVRRLVPLYLADPGRGANPYVSPLLAARPVRAAAGVRHVGRVRHAPGRRRAVRRTAAREAGVPATFSLQRGHVHFSAALPR